VKEIVYEKLIMYGQLPLFKHLMRERLYQSGWIYAHRQASIEYVKRVGIENVNVSHMMTDMVPVGRDLFNQSSLRQELHRLLVNFALLFFQSDPSALRAPMDYKTVPVGIVQFQTKDVRPEPRRRTHSHDHSIHSHMSKRSHSGSRNGRSRSRNSNNSRSSNRSHKDRSSSGSRSRSRSGSRSSGRSPLPPRPITPQPPVLPPVLRVERPERIETKPPPKPKPRKSSVEPAKPLPPPQPPREAPRPAPVSVDEDGEALSTIKQNDEEEEELPDI